MLYKPKLVRFTYIKCFTPRACLNSGILDRCSPKRKKFIEKLRLAKIEVVINIRHGKKAYHLFKLTVKKLYLRRAVIFADHIQQPESLDGFFLVIQNWLT
jgi:hypothetical protein